MKLTIVLFLSFFVSYSKTQSLTVTKKDTAKQDFDVLRCSRWIELPAFPGGQAAWVRHLTSNIPYSFTTVFNQPDIIFTVQFIVSKKGIVTQAALLGPLQQNLAAEMIRLINSSPKWVPAKQNGRATSWRVVQQVTLKKAVINVQPCESDPNKFIPIS